MQWQRRKKDAARILTHLKRMKRENISIQGSCTHLMRLLSGGKRRSSVWAVLMAAMIINGCIPAPGMAGCFYVLLPYAAQVVSAAALGVALLSVATAGNPLREYQYEAAVKKIPMRSRLAAIFAGASVLGELLYLIQNGAGNAAGMAALFLVLEVIACVCAAWICKYSKSWFLQVSPIDNLPKNHYNC